MLDTSLEEGITVVIPTLLMGPKEVFSYTLEQLNSNDLVKEIIIIDNTEDKSYEKYFLVTPKINILKLEGNQGASYNLGMTICKTKYYLLINDDVACRSSIMDSCFKIMEIDKEIGLLQIETKVIQPLEDYIKDDTKEEVAYSIPHNPRASMCGWFQFGRTENWIEIPKELKYFYGDDLLLEIMKHKGKKVARIISDHISHIESSTVGKIIPMHTVIMAEHKIYLEVLKRIFNETNPTQ